MLKLFTQNHTELSANEVRHAPTHTDTQGAALYAHTVLKCNNLKFLEKGIAQHKHHENANGRKGNATKNSINSAQNHEAQSNCEKISFSLYTRSNAQRNEVALRAAKKCIFCHS